MFFQKTRCFQKCQFGTISPRSWRGCYLVKDGHWVLLQTTHTNCTYMPIFSDLFLSRPLYCHSIGECTRSRSSACEKLASCVPTCDGSPVVAIPVLTTGLSSQYNPHQFVLPQSRGLAPTELQVDWQPPGHPKTPLQRHGSWACMQTMPAHC